MPKLTNELLTLCAALILQNSDSLGKTGKAIQYK